MLPVYFRSCSRIALIVLGFLVLSNLQAQAPIHYEATLESLNQHPLPQWYADAKLGIFIHWGLYSVPGWAPLVHPEHDFTSQEEVESGHVGETVS
jgi:alpha-L-fucosidase